MILGGGDVLGAAETGTGKTGAFGIPVLQLIHEQLREEAIEAADSASGPKKKDAKVEFRMSMEDKEAIFTPDASGYICSVLSKTAWGGGRSSAGVLAGRYFYEVTCESMSEKESTARVGFSTAAASYTLGTCPNGYGFGSTGKKSNAGAFTTYGASFSEGDTLGCKLDLASRSISFSLNGADLGDAFTIPPTQQRTGFYPALCLKASTVRVNFGNGAGAGGAPPPGYSWIARAEARDAVCMGQGGVDGGDAKGATPLCIIMEPSRDLAEQTYKCMLEFKKYMASPSVEVVLLVGGVDMRDNIKVGRSPPLAPRRDGIPSGGQCRGAQIRGG